MLFVFLKRKLTVHTKEQWNGEEVRIMVRKEAELSEPSGAHKVK